MTKSQLISQYKLRFTNAIEKDGYVEKIPDTFHPLFSSFLMDWTTVGADDIIEVALPVIQEVLDATQPIPPQSDYNLGTHTATCFYYDGVFCFNKGTGPSSTTYRPPLFTIPPQDLFDIFVLWKDFIISSPAYGEKVK